MVKIIIVKTYGIWFFEITYNGFEYGKLRIHERNFPMFQAGIFNMGL